MIPINELFNDPDEWHIWLIGVSHGFFFWQKHPPLTIENERHYYEQGKIAGMMVFGVFMACLGWLVKSLLF